MYFFIVWLQHVNIFQNISQSAIIYGVVVAILPSEYVHGFLLTSLLFDMIGK